MTHTPSITNTQASEALREYGNVSALALVSGGGIFPWLTHCLKSADLPSYSGK